MIRIKRAQEEKSKILVAIHKKAQEQKSKILVAIPKKAQEEIVGFSMIIVIVAVILIIFLSFSINSPQNNTVESHEVESFLQVLMQKTSDCGSTDNLRYYSVKELVFRCYSSSLVIEKCFNGRNICDILLKEIGLVSNKSWNPGLEEPIKGYSLDITVDGERFKSILTGTQTKSSKGSFQELMKEGKLFRLEFHAYY